MNITTREVIYPNGKLYLAVFIDTLLIGNVDVVEGGYLPFGKRKPRATIEEAARAMIDTKMSQLVNEMQQWKNYLWKLDLELMRKE